MDEESKISSLTELFEDKLLTTALRCNISLFDYWNMTLKEVQLVIKSYEEQLKWEISNQQNNAYTIAYLTSVFVGSVLNGKNPPGIEDVFPTEANIEAAHKAKIERMRQQFKNFAVMHNITRKES